MVATAVRRNRGADEADMEDVVQEVFINLIKALRNYDPMRPLEAYILEIARRVKISYLRSASAAKRGGPNPGRRRVDLHDRLADDVGAVQVAARQPGQEQRLMEAQEAGLLRRALQNVSENCRKLLAYRYDRGLSYKEIAETLGEKEGTLRVKLQRCLTALAQHYSGIESGERGKRW